MKKEKKESGMVGFKTYSEFFKLGGISFFIFCLMLFAISVFVRIAADFWIGSWASDRYDLSDNEYI